LTDQSKKDDAQAQFTKAQKAEEGRKAMAEYEAAAIATRAKTERLRALRLAREAEVARNTPAKPAKKKTAKSGKSAPAASGTLSDWLEDQQKGGHRS
jgi:hypothetical protein